MAFKKEKDKNYENLFVAQRCKDFAISGKNLKEVALWQAIVASRNLFQNTLERTNS